MNLIASLVDLVDSHSEVEQAVDALAAEIEGSRRNKAQLERSLDVLRQAFRRHVASQGGSATRVICAFCKKTEEEVAKIVAASDVAICGECVALCNDVIEERIKPGAGDTPPLTRALAILRRRISGR